MEPRIQRRREAEHMLRYQHHAIGKLIDVMDELEKRGFISHDDRGPQARLTTLSRLCGVVAYHMTFAALTQRDINEAAGAPAGHSPRDRYEPEVLMGVIRNYCHQPDSGLRWHEEAEQDDPKEGRTMTTAKTERRQIITVRDLDPADKAELTDLFRITHEAAAEHAPEKLHGHIREAIESEIAENIAHVEQYAEYPNHAFVATLDERVAGFAALKEIDGETTELKNVMVHPSVQGMGIARRLMEAAEARAAAEGYASIILWTMPYLTAAFRMYERRGYATEHQGEPPGNMAPELKPCRMRLSLRRA